MVRSERFQHNSQCTTVIIFCLIKVSQLTVYKTQITVRRCHINMLRSELFQPNSQCTIVIIFCLIKVTQLTVYKTQVIVKRCRSKWVKSSFCAVFYHFFNIYYSTNSHPSIMTILRFFRNLQTAIL